MDKEKRATLDRITEKVLDSLFDEFWRDAIDDRDLFMDSLMQWLQNTFGVGEILQYIQIGLYASASDDEDTKVDMNRCGEMIQKVMNHLPPHEFNLFGEVATTKERERFKAFWSLYHSNKLAFLEAVQDGIENVKSKKDILLLIDAMQIWLANAYSIEEDLEVMKHKYGIKKGK
jgi:hypothetical protein